MLFVLDEKKECNFSMFDVLVCLNRRYLRNAVSSDCVLFKGNGLVLILDGDFILFPVDVRIVFAQPRFSKDNIIAFKRKYIKVDFFGMFLDLEISEGGELLTERVVLSVSFTW